MGYATGTINSATPAVDLMTALDAQFTGNGWTFVETYTSSTNVTNIYKSPGTSNSFGTDFYVGVNRTSTTSSVAFIVAEVWNTATKRFRKYAQVSNTVPDTDYSINDATGLLPTTSSLAFAPIGVLTSTPFTYWVNVNVDRCIATSSVTGAQGGYVGLFDSLLPSDPFPLAALNFYSSAIVPSTAGAVTREPLQVSASSTNFSAYIPAIVSTSTVQNLIFGGIVGFTSWIYSTTGGLVAQRIALASGRGTVTNHGLRGLPKDLVYVPAGSLAGDTLSYTLGSTTYTYVRVPLTNTSTAINSVWMPTF